METGRRTRRRRSYDDDDGDDDFDAERDGWNGERERERERGGGGVLLFSSLDNRVELVLLFSFERKGKERKGRKRDTSFDYEVCLFNEME